VLRFLHAADVHLDSPLVGLDRYESAPVEAMRGATRRAFEALVRLAVDEEVAFVLLAGDLFDGDWRDYRTGLYFVEQMGRLREAGIPVLVVAGNHDAASQLTRRLRPPDNVRLLSTRGPETVVLEAHGVAVHGQGFAGRTASDDLAAAFPVGDPALFNVGLLHTSLDGREGHATYAPTSLQVLAQKGYRYWALGHVHRREVVSTDPWVVFPGNLQGRHARELGPKGCTLVTVDGGEIASVEERHVDVMRWARCAVGADGAATTSELLDRVSHALTTEAGRADGRPLAVRVEVVGSTPCHDDLAARPDHFTQEVRALAAAQSAEAWVEKVRLATRRPASLPPPPDLDPGDATALREALADIHKALPAELLGGEDPLDLADPEVVARLATEARDLLLARIAREGTPE
jgi:predicted phosphodiesterase